MSQNKHELNRWSSQFGLYKYPDTEPEYDEPLKREPLFKRCIKYILIAMISTISIIVVCLLMVDFITTENTPKINISMKNNNQTDRITLENAILKLPLKDDDDSVTISKQNISLVESSIHNISRMDSLASDYQNPKPFGFEYKHSFPMPFHKNEHNNNNYPQLSNYRSANKMRNIEELIQYMGDQLFKNSNEDNAKTSNPNRRIKFSGIYLRPRKSNIHETGNLNVYERKSNQKRIKDEVNSFPTAFSKQSVVEKQTLDPFFIFKPNQPGDINLLAEKKFRFSPTYAQSRLNHHKIPKNPIKYIPLYENNKCDDYNCNKQENSDYSPSLDVEEYDFEEQPTLKIDTGTIKGHNKKRPLSVMLDIYPMEDQDEQTMAFPDHLKEPPTTSRPKIKLRPKPLYPPPFYSHPQYSNYYPNYGFNPNNYYYHNNYNRQISNRSPFRPQTMLPVELQTRYGRKRNISENVPTQMLVHLNLYPRKKILKKNKNEENIYEVIDRRSKDDNDYTPGINITDDDIILSNYSKDARRSIIDAIIAKYNNNPREFPVNEDNENVTIDDIRKGYGFKFPGPKMIKPDLPDGISESAVRLLSLYRAYDDVEAEEETKHITKRNHNSSHSHEVFNTTVPNVNSTEFGESFAVFELNSNESTSEKYESLANDTKKEEFIAVPILDVQ